jgi:predicted MFS family arabinose efflux permease
MTRATDGVRALRWPAYRILSVAFVARGLQVWMQLVALPLLVLALDGSAADVGLVTGLFLLPIAFVAPLAGVLGDLIDRRQLLVGLAVYGAIHGLVMAALVVAGAMTIPLLAVFAGVYGLMNAVEIPIRLAFIADVVPRDDLANGLVLGQMAFTLTRIIGPAIAALVAAGPGLAWLFTLIGLAGVVVAIATFGVRVSSPPRDDSTVGSPRRALVDGLRYAASRRSIRQPLLLLGAVAVFGLSVQVVLPLYTVDHLGLNEAEFGLLLAVMGVGALLASIPLAYLRPRDARLALLGASVAVSVCVTGLAWTNLVPVAFLLSGVLGAASNVALSGASVVLQYAVDTGVRARVLGLQAAVFQGGQGLGGLLMGLATDELGIVTTMLVGAIIVGLSTLVLWLGWPPASVDGEARR